MASRCGSMVSSNFVGARGVNAALFPSHPGGVRNPYSPSYTCPTNGRVSPFAPACNGIGGCGCNFQGPTPSAVTNWARMNYPMNTCMNMSCAYPAGYGPYWGVRGGWINGGCGTSAYENYGPYMTYGVPGIGAAVSSCYPYSYGLGGYRYSPCAGVSGCGYGGVSCGVAVSPCGGFPTGFPSSCGYPGGYPIGG